MSKVQRLTSAPEVYFHQENDRKGGGREALGLKNKNLDEMYKN